MKKALVIVPSITPSASQCCDIVRAALESAGYAVSAAEGVFESQSDANDLLAAVQDADLIVCEVTGKQPHVFYYLGLAHALGKRVLMLSEMPADLPFPSASGMSLVHNPLELDWEDKFRADLTATLPELEASQPIAHAQEATRGKARPFIRWALSNEIKFNLSELERVRAKDLVFLGVWQPVDRGSIHIVSCETDAFESEDVHRALAGLGEKYLGSLKTVYHGFYQVNQKARIADREVAVRTAQEYLQAVREFENNLMDAARDLIEQLVAEGL